ncbi:MAG: VWA domain-containing protein [Candidatus Korobacteraceae bacterium]
MKSRRFLFTFLLVALIGAGWLLAWSQTQEAPQTQPQAAEGSTTPTIKAETRLVLVDTVVTDKKGNYIRDLTQKDFRVWEDNKAQPVKTFSAETDPNAPSGEQRRYLILFFDNSTMNMNDQAQARAAALKFLDGNAGANRYIAVVNFGGTLQVVQNFTTDADRLKQAVKNIGFSAASPNGEVASAQPVQTLPVGIPQVGNAQSNFGVRTLLLALRNMAKGLASVPGRKTLVLLSAGFPLNPADPNLPEQMSELTAAIDSCNKANVAIYPIDVRGLTTPVGAAPELQIFPDSARGHLASATLTLSGDDPPAHLIYVQRGGSGGSGGGGHAGGATGSTGHTGTGTATSGSRSSTGSSQTTSSVLNAPYSAAHTLVPQMSNGTDARQVLYELAQGTGGFVIVNTNDLLGGLQKIAQEQTQYYLLGYTPPASDEGSCHTLRVKVDRGDTVVRSRTGYCNVRPTDLLAGKPVEKQLENQATGSQPGNIAATMLAPYFYASANTARVNLAIEIPASAIKFTKEKGKMHAEINVLGLAYKQDGTVAARFSDNVDLTFDGKSEVEEFAKKPYHYENQFEIASGQYQLKVAFSSGGESFGKLEMPLVVDTYDTKQFGLSALALSKELHPLSQVSSGLDAALLEDRTPLVAQGVQIIPAGSDRFKKSDPATFYVEIYDPLLTTATPPNVRIHIQVVDRKTGQQKVELGGPVPGVKAGNPVIALGVKLPMDKLVPGSYRLELQAADSAGNTTAARTADFEVE